MRHTRKMRRQLEKEYRPFRDLLFVTRHYFPQLIEWFDHIKDPRHQSYITYSQTELIMLRILAYCSHLKSMRHMNETFNNPQLIKLMQILFSHEHEEVCHGDTINYYLEMLDGDQLRSLLYKAFQALKDKRVLDDYRICKIYYQMIFDGVTLYSYKKPHIDNCLEIHHQDGSITYRTDMVLAVISMGNVVIPIDFEIVKNESGEYDKQDCETNAAKRLMKRIKEKLPRLPICFSGDALYFSEPMLELLEKYGWHYIIRYKEGSAKTIEEYYDVAKKGKDVSELKEEKKEYEYYNEIPYHEKYKTNRIKMMEESGKRFDYLTDYIITDKNVTKMIEHGRNRWKIENKAFNDQKNHGYELGHAFSYDNKAIQGHISLMLLSHLIMQLLEHYERTKKLEKSIRKLGEDIKEALRTESLSAQDVMDITRKCQIRLAIPY